MQFLPKSYPAYESQKLYDAALPYDVVIIFNPGGWGDVPLSKAEDFAPIIEGIQGTLKVLGYSSTAVTYTRTLTGFAGRFAGVQEHFSSFKYGSQIQSKDIEYLIDSFPDKRIILAGFSNGGGFTSQTIQNFVNHDRVCSIVVGVPGWYETYSSGNSLVLDNNRQDVLSAFDLKTIAANVIKTPYRWLRAKINGGNLSIALALQFPGHEYSWSSPLVGSPIIQFLENRFEPKISK